MTNKAVCSPGFWGGEHEWLTQSWSGRGNVAGLRTCARCRRVETLLYDYSRDDWRWVSGKFADDSNKIFIFAASEGSFVEAKSLLDKEFELPAEYVWMQFASDFSALEGLRSPAIYLAEDWLEAEIVKHPRFRLLASVGHT